MIMVFMKSGSLFVGSSMSWVYGYDPEPIIFLTIKIRREHETLPHSNAACHQLTPLTCERKNSCMLMRVQGRLMQVRFIEIHQVFGGKKIRSDTFLTEWYEVICFGIRTVQYIVLLKAYNVRSVHFLLFVNRLASFSILFVSSSSSPAEVAELSESESVG